MRQEQWDGFELYIYEPPPSPEPPLHALFFAHANGIPAQSYRKLFGLLSQELKIVIFSYDLRGIGRTSLLPLFPSSSKEWTWEKLAADHIRLFTHLRNTQSSQTQWIFCGHSLGAWISLLSAGQCGVKKIILLDPPLLSPQKAILWFLIKTFGFRNKTTPLSQRTRNRKKIFPSSEALYEHFRKSRFTLHWPEDTLIDYLEGSFFSPIKGDNRKILRHSPEWEAHLFEEYPIFAARGFLSLPRKLRKTLLPVIVRGTKSDTCYRGAKFWIQQFFPTVKWVAMPDATHMFPLEKPDTTVEVFSQILQRKEK